ncbi:hypothetical protein T08_9992 [Trichinella sp. T8]|nr:hypothetical protein T08_9992 [Trichinella sp. T8]
MLKHAVAQTELPLARTIDADYVAKKAVIRRSLRLTDDPLYASFLPAVSRAGDVRVRFGYLCCAHSILPASPIWLQSGPPSEPELVSGGHYHLEEVSGRPVG